LDEATGAEPTTHPRELIRPVGDQHRVAQPLPDCGRAVLDVKLERGTSRHRPIDIAVVDAEVLGHHYGVIDHHPSARASRPDVAIEVRLRDTGVGENSLKGLSVMTDRIELRRLRVVAERNSDDYWCSIWLRHAETIEPDTIPAPCGDHQPSSTTSLARS